MKKKMVEIAIDLPNELIYALCKEAHYRDITLNKLVNKILKKEIKRLKREQALEESLNSDYYLDNPPPAECHSPNKIIK